MGSRGERGILKEYDWTSSWDSSFSHSIPSTGLRTLSSSRQSQYCSFIKQRSWKVAGLKDLLKHSTKEEQGRWERLTKDSICQEVLEAEGGEYLPRKCLSKSQGSFVLLKTHPGKHGRRTLYTIPCRMEGSSPWATFSWVQPADFRCSCYTISFQKYEGFLKIHNAVMIPAAKIREKRTMRNM